MPVEIRSAAVRAARLLYSSPDAVFDDLATYGIRDETLERGLLNREDPLIDLALAKFASNQEIVSTIYKEALSVAKPSSEFRHAWGIRIACLTNECATEDTTPECIFGEEELGRIVDQGTWEEIWALFRNLKIPEDFFLSLYERKGFAATLSGDRWTSLVRASIHAPRWKMLNVESRSSWSMIVRLLEIIPATTDWLQDIFHLLDNLPFSSGNRFPGFDAVTKRWTEVTTGLAEEETPEGHEVKAEQHRLIQQILCLIYLHFGRDTLPPQKSDSSDSQRRHGKIIAVAAVKREIAKLQDLQLRCVYYATRDVSEAMMEEGYRRDHGTFAKALLFNDSLYFQRRLRRLFEEKYLPRELREDYLRQCTQRNRLMPYLQLEPLSSSLWSEPDTDAPQTFASRGVLKLMVDVKASNERLIRIEMMLSIFVALLFLVLSISATLLGLEIFRELTSELFRFVGWRFKLGFGDVFQGSITLAIFFFILIAVLALSSWLYSRLSAWMESQVQKAYDIG